MWRYVVLLALIGCVAGEPPLFEQFDGNWQLRWVHATDPKYTGEFEVTAVGETEDAALSVPTKARYYGISGLLSSPVDPSEGVALQFELKLEDSNFGCGGAYLKFLTADSSFTPKGLKDDTPYTIMFGPDRCGSTNKVHFIIRHKNPVTGTIEEKHLKGNPIMAPGTETHVYTAVLRPDNTYSVLVDGKESKGGSLFEDFEPPFLPPKEIDDSHDSKPDDWVDEAKIPDPDATKPDDWDEDAPRMIPDEDAVMPTGWLEDEPTEVPDSSAAKPEDWDDEEDGEWEPTLIPNPKCKSAPGCGPWQHPNKPNPDYKGKWTAPLVDNPAYKGPWAPRKIPNPEYHEDKEPLKHIGKIGAAAIEIWTMESDYSFDNIVVGSEAAVTEIREKYWQPKHEAESKAKARKADESTKSSHPLHEEITAKFIHFIDSLEFLGHYREQIAPLYVAMKQSPPLVYSMVGVPLLLTLFVVLRVLSRLFGGGKKADRAAVAKKTDAVTPDVPVANGNSIADDAQAAAGTGVSEIEEEPDREEDTGVKRRSRREH